MIHKTQPWLFLLLCISMGTLFSSCSHRPGLLVYTRTEGWHHSSIPAGIQAIQQWGAQHGFAVDTTTDPTRFTDRILKRYQAIIFCNTTGNVLNAKQQAAFERYIQAGGGFVGIHSASDTEYDWSWYGQLVGARFASHPLHPGIRKATVVVADTAFPGMNQLPARWERSDEWYNFRDLYTGIHVLAWLDENTYVGGTLGAHHPISWYHDFDGGRAFYTGMGHTEESYQDSTFLRHLAGGIRYAVGTGKPLDYTKAYAEVIPDENRFVKTVLKANLNSPMELTMAKDGRIFFSELFGDVYEYDTHSNQSRLLHHFPVTTIGGMGVLGITVDPNFEQNHFMYVYYAPGGQTKEPLWFHLSRFTLRDGRTLDTTSEKVLLRVPVQENSGSHHGGSMAWDKAGNLYLSTGDGTSPFPSEGYAPLDERPGKDHYSLDSQRGAGNTNDYKGKILRIHPEADGTYTIPEGNLFPPGKDSTLPEIYVMGARNPYRIALNPRTSVLYWGEIGPDAGEDSKRGPRGYDEFNQARTAGNYGWPYFVGDNYAYADWDFATRKAGLKFDPAHPVNHSPNNTGLKNLPPARPAMIWYPYAPSPRFPELGEGGRSAMAGAFYAYDSSVHTPGQFPAYYDGALFVFDWMRNWVMALRFDDSENYVRDEPFMAAQGDFRRPIDLVFGPDGIMYMLEYGSVYGMANPDARLVKIEYYTGNRPPIAQAGIVDTAAAALQQARAFLTSDQTTIPTERTISGQPPLKVTFTAQRSKDLDDDDAVSYRWAFDEAGATAATDTATHTYTKNGTYHPILQVHDRAGAVSADTLTVYVGNTAPSVRIYTPGNRSVIRPGQPFSYQVRIADAEGQAIDPSHVQVNYRRRSVQGGAYQGGDQFISPGEAVINGSDCSSCHNKDKKLVGPAYLDIAHRYTAGAATIHKLALKIIQGGAGNWGDDLVMSAHPQLSPADAEEAVRYILSLTNPAATADQATAIPATGTLHLTWDKNDPQAQYVLTATYRDPGGDIQVPLTGTDRVVLRQSAVPAVYADAHVGFNRFRNDLSQGGHKAYLLFKDMDLSHIRQLAFQYASGDAAGTIEVRLDSEAGPVIATTSYSATGSWDHYAEITATLTQPVEGQHKIYILGLKPLPPNDAIIRFKAVRFME